MFGWKQVIEHQKFVLYCTSRPFQQKIRTVWDWNAFMVSIRYSKSPMGMNFCTAMASAFPQCHFLLRKSSCKKGTNILSLTKAFWGLSDTCNIFQKCSHRKCLGHFLETGVLENLMNLFKKNSETTYGEQTEHRAHIPDIYLCFYCQDKSKACCLFLRISSANSFFPFSDFFYTSDIIYSNF